MVLSLFYLFYGLYVLGFYILQAVETYKGQSLTSAPIPISVWFVVISAVCVIVGEVLLSLITRGDD